MEHTKKRFMIKKDAGTFVTRYAVMTNAKCVVIFQTQRKIVNHANILSRRIDTWT